MIHRHNYHLFQPLFYQVATAVLSLADIAEPIRVVLRHQLNATVLLDEVIGIAASQVETRFGRSAELRLPGPPTGLRYTYFGHSEWPRVAPALNRSTTPP